MTTLFKKDPNDLGRVINEVNPENEWVFRPDTIPTRKFDGTACAIINGELYKRYDCKIDKKTGEYKRSIPIGAIPCQEPDEITGHHPHWVKCEPLDPSNKYHFEAFLNGMPDGTYELCGPKINGNKENLDSHQLIRHGSVVLSPKAYDFKSLREFLYLVDIEGIVFHNGNKMCKIRKSDFGIKR